MFNYGPDQASSLRMMQNNHRVKVIATTGGKGGVGKSNVSLNLAVSLAKTGKRVMVLDADLGLANLDIMLGIRVAKNLSHVLSGELSLDDIIVKGPQNVMILPASSGVQAMVELSPQDHATLIHAFANLQQQVDVLIIDTAAGISDMVLSFARAAQDVLVTVCDEPSSITDAYALIKLLSTEYGVNRFKVVANMLQNVAQGQRLFTKLTRVTDQFLSAHLELVACIPYDEHVKAAIRSQQVVVEAYPRAPASQAFRLFAQQVSQWPLPEQASGHLEFFMEKLLRPQSNPA